MLRRPKRSEIEVVALEEEEEEKNRSSALRSVFFCFDKKLMNNRKNEYIYIYI